jgi:ribosomal protein L32
MGMYIEAGGDYMNEDKNEIVNLITCTRCGQLKVPHNDNPHLCEDCVKAENNRVSYYRQHNLNWMEVAKEAEIPVWERQPSETDWEWTVWLHYRDAWPCKRMTYREVAVELNTSVEAVKKIGGRWTFQARLQAWATYCDELTLNQRKQEIVDMNKHHIDMAVKIRDKLNKAIDNIKPEQLEVKDIQGLFKLVTEIERKARLDDVTMVATSVVKDDNPELKKSPTKTSDLKEVVDILAKAGVLNGNFGIKQTTTTEIVTKE